MKVSLARSTVTDLSEHAPVAMAQDISPCSDNMKHLLLALNDRDVAKFVYEYAKGEVENRRHAFRMYIASMEDLNKQFHLATRYNPDGHKLIGTCDHGDMMEIDVDKLYDGQDTPGSDKPQSLKEVLNQLAEALGLDTKTIL